MTRSQKAAQIFAKYDTKIQQNILNHMPIQGALTKNKVESLISYMWQRWEKFNIPGLVNMYIKKDVQLELALLEELLLLF